MVKEFNKIIKILLINIFFLALALFIIELFSGDLFFKKKLKCSYILCNANYTYTTDLYTSAKIKISYKKDQYGFRGRKSDKIEKINILTVGGSTTDERYLNLEDTWSEQLEKFFKDNSNYIDVVNAGIDGQSSFGHIWNMQEWFNKIDDLKINNIIFYIGINEKEYPGRHDLNIDKVRYPKKILYILKYNNGFVSKVYEFFVHRYNPIDELNVAHSKNRKANYKKIDPRNSFNTKFLSGNINELIKISKKLNINPIFVTQRTARWKLSDNQIYSISRKNDYYSKEKIISETILKICKKNKLICIDGFNQLNLDIEDTYDLVHTNPKGSKKIAKFIFENLKKVDLNNN